MPAQVTSNWWFYLFAAWTAMGMGGLALQNLLKPAEVFSGAYPMGYDRITDGLSIFPGTSPRLEYLMRQTVGSYIYIMGTEIFVTLYARTLPPPYQKGVMSRIIWPALLSDAFLVGLTLYAHPEEVVKNPSHWTEAMQGILVFVPIGSVIKLLWVLGVGAKKTEKVA